MSLEITPVRTRRELDQFIKLPYELHKDTLWVPPLLMDQRKLLSREKNPFFEHAEAEYFLARKNGRLVGRISAHVDNNFNEFQQNKWGLWGFFECEDDQEVADGLLGVAAAWLTERGRDKMVGPMSFTTNDECGLLVEGYDRPPIVLMPWNPPYYLQLIENAGLTKAMDTLMWELYISEKDSVHPAIWDMAAKVESEHNITVRPMRKRDMQAEIERFLDVYNAAWEKNWGFVPLTDDEVRHYAKDLKPVLDPNWAFIAQEGDKTVGAALTLPDFNQVLKKLNGRLLPFGWLKAIIAKRKIDRVRVIVLGVKPEYQHAGVAAKFYELHFDSAARTPQHGGEMGWILETNKPMNRAMEGMGGKVVSRYRFFERLL